ncbi:acyltransferase-domain-containing protein [Trichophaea hybrida]|nr:acyltransferase-domain-containing protein [Trichophaea hybrida]
MKAAAVAPDPTSTTPPDTASSATTTIPVFETEESRDLISANFTHFRQDPFSFLKQVSLHYSGTGWRGYNDFIGQPIFYKGFSEQMKGQVMRSTIVRKKIVELAERRANTEAKEGRFIGMDEGAKEKRREEIKRQLVEVAEAIVDGMICKFESKRFIRGAYYLCMQLLSRTYDQGIHVSSQEIQNIRRVAALAAQKKQSLIFLPCHRSHVDYVSLQVICYRLGIALPVVVAGENLNFPLVGQFLQHAGAMFIRRSFGGDELYQATVQGYVDTILKGGYNFSCFIEGGRSRTGKLLQPKFGILGYLLDSLLSGAVEDATIIPVSTQYDKVIEMEGYVNELLGIPKQKENLWDFLNSSKYLSLKMGRVDVRFHEPWSLRTFMNDFLTKHKVDLNVSSMIPKSEVRLKMLKNLGYKVLGDINAASVVMPTALIGTVLLTLRGRGVGKSELVRRIDWLSDRIRAKGGRVTAFGGLGTAEVVKRGITVLGDLVGRIDGLAEETFYAVDRFQLSFYRNMVIHLFITEAVVAAAMYTRIKQGGGISNQRIPYRVLFNQVSFLSELFRGEFVFPTEGIVTNLHTTLKGLETDGVINIGYNEKQEFDYVELTDEERQCGRENYDFYCFLIWPFIESAWLAGVVIIGLTPPPGHHDVWVPVKEAQDMAQLAGKTLYHQGDLSYFEAVNKESLKNAFQRFEEEGILVTRKSKTRKNPPVLKLSSEWIPERDSETGGIIANGPLWQFVESIAISRREGKNRRDSASVGTRVLTLVDRLGRELFEETLERKRIEEEDAEVEIRTGRKRRRRARL